MKSTRATTIVVLLLMTSIAVAVNQKPEGTGLRCLEGLISPQFDGDILRNGSVKPMNKLYQSTMTNLLGENNNGVKCFVKVVVTKSDTKPWTRSGTQLEYGIQPSFLCPSSQPCQRYTSKDGGVCCCDGNDCNNYSMQEAFDKVHEATIPPTVAISEATPSTTATVSPNADYVGIWAVLCGICITLVFVCTVLLATACFLMRKHGYIGKSQAERQHHQ